VLAAPDFSRVLTRTPGIQYRVLTSQGPIYGYDGGWADLRSRTPMTAATTMMGYSMSKTITAAAVMLLVEHEKIDLDRAVTEYVGTLPYDAVITVRQLLTHTSGLPNPIPLRWVHLAAQHARFDEHAALAAVLAAHQRLRFRPGSKYAYSNIGYWLLGRVVECASGESFTSYVTTHVLQPIGVSAGELGYEILDSRRHATGYLEKYSMMNLAKRVLIAPEFIGAYAGRWLELESHYPNGPAFGGLVGTAAGFGKFLQDQLRDRSALFTDNSRRLFCAQQQTARGRAVPMTLGWHIGEFGNRRFFYKEGGGGGFHSMMRLYPQEGIGTVAMVNVTGFDVERLLNAIDALFLRSLG
jgi:CubicO group peptidase (beta-lactamase class C family)